MVFLSVLPSNKGIQRFEWYPVLGPLNYSKLCYKLMMYKNFFAKKNNIRIYLK
ncbi:hypothetical protein CLV84_4336 [Neolewinella xylanilytica]|uniref:Uncharacterized protein n=1 Tax=Neolewinella xylanilytica TaxID=1514080 RepID=A0A2S6HZM2_9BACT|nr:hypothetical protein CLV84_4336 [Neolewinella xylanilytica]